jgi:hypothetical protein
MDALKVFRLLIVAEIVLIGASAAVAFLPSETLPPEIDRWLSEEGWPLLQWIEERGGAVTIASVAVLLAFVAAYFAALIGLLLLKRWARTLYVAVFVAGAPLYLFMGVTLTTPIAAFVDYLLAACSGAVLALLFIGPVQERFAHA